MLTQISQYGGNGGAGLFSGWASHHKWEHLHQESRDFNRTSSSGTPQKLNNHGRLRNKWGYLQAAFVGDRWLRQREDVWPWSRSKPTGLLVRWHQGCLELAGIPKAGYFGATGLVPKAAWVAGRPTSSFTSSSSSMAGMPWIQHLPRWKAPTGTQPFPRGAQFWWGRHHGQTDGRMDPRFPSERVKHLGLQCWGHCRLVAHQSWDHQPGLWMRHRWPDAPGFKLRCVPTPQTKIYGIFYMGFTLILQFLRSLVTMVRITMRKRWGPNRRSAMVVSPRWQPWRQIGRCAATCEAGRAFLGLKTGHGIFSDCRAAARGSVGGKKNFWHWNREV